ncbi:MAG: lysylphosphatidylglycerol synthase domain-containing protein [Cyanobacteria bacterium CAN_BIN43]|nr:lysylphosphatidylglycerol synthase domain-containing protein [Cyanobacteria bacterium CAN_BIN43]
MASIFKLSRLKPYLLWVILGGTVFFIASAIHQNWQEVAAIRISATGYLNLAIAFLITLLAHIWSGWVWSWILRELNQPVTGLWSIKVYLITNLAKYLPGNVWHFYGRVIAAKDAGFSVEAATLSVLLEPLLMAAAALAIALTTGSRTNGITQLLCLSAVLIAIHPRFLNPLLQLASRLKGKSQDAQAVQNQQPVQIRRYPLFPLLGEAGFVALRGLGFFLTLSALSPIAPAQIPLVFSAFSFAWVLGLVVPGAPGGIGVFEATAIALLNSQIPTGTIIGGVALYRITSIFAEVSGAGLARVKTR